MKEFHQSRPLLNNEFAEYEVHSEIKFRHRAKCQPHPIVEVMMDHITVNGKKLTKIKRLVPSHVVINKCTGIYYLTNLKNSYSGTLYLLSRNLSVL